MISNELFVSFFSRSTLSDPRSVGADLEAIRPGRWRWRIIVLLSAALTAAALERQLRGDSVDWQREFAEPLNYGVETFRAFVAGWYDGSLQQRDLLPRQQENIRRMICSVLAGYVWTARTVHRPSGRPPPARAGRAVPRGLAYTLFAWALSPRHSREV